ncbi:hypothetical protein CL628_02260 [bacterium]|nr:hypothetical protein [bacterium]|tara:strand:+ start:242 stop:568 length:327 start_codon:yes stop_codon:yes gene_type:complete
MQTLLQKVEKIETAAQQKIQAARDAGTDNINKLVADEEQVLEEVRGAATKRGQAIVKEKVDAAKGTLNALHQEEDKSVATIHDTAKQNRSAAIKFVINLFNTDYLAKN